MMRQTGCDNVCVVSEDVVVKANRSIVYAGAEGRENSELHPHELHSLAHHGSQCTGASDSATQLTESVFCGS